MSNLKMEIDDYEQPDESYKKIQDQIDDEDRLWDMYTNLKEFVEYASIPLFENLNIEILSQFVTPLRVRLF